MSISYIRNPSTTTSTVNTENPPAAVINLRATSSPAWAIILFAFVVVCAPGTGEVTKVAVAGVQLPIMPVLP